MNKQTADLHINPSEETIRLGPLAVRFLPSGDYSNGRIAVFELVVPGAQRLAAPAHSHDHYEERSMASTECLPGLSTENKSTLVRGRRCGFRGARFTGSTTTAAGTRRHSA